MKPSGQAGGKKANLEVSSMSKELELGHRENLGVVINGNKKVTQNEVFGNSNTDKLLSTWKKELAINKDG